MGLNAVGRSLQFQLECITCNVSEDMLMFDSIDSLRIVR